MAAFCSFALPQNAGATTNAYFAAVNGLYGGGADNSSLNMGHSFTITGTSLQISALGVFDFGGDGLNASHLVGIFTDNGNYSPPVPNASVTVPSGTNAPLVNGYRYQPLPSPVILGPGTYYVVAFQLDGYANQSDPYSDNNAPANSNNGFNGIAGVTDNGSVFEINPNQGPGFAVGGSAPYTSTNDFGSASFLYDAGLIATVTPAATNVLAGQAVTLTATASGQTPISFQWYFTNSSPEFPAGAYAQTDGDGVTNVVVTNGGFGYTSPPNIQFLNGGGSGADAYATISNGVLTAITVTDAGSGYTNAPDVQIDPPALLEGETNSTLTLGDFDAGNAGSYWVVVSNIYGSATSGPAGVTLVYPPAIVTQPSGTNVSLHGSATLSVTASGTAPLQYQWWLGTNSVTNATNSTLALTNFKTNEVGAYSVTVSNAYGQVASDPALLEMLPSLTAPFTGVDGFWGQPETLSVGATGSGDLEYQWYYDGTAIDGATNSTLTFGSIQFTNGGSYSVVVSSEYGSVTNTAEQVVVNPAGLSLGFCPSLTITGVVGYTYIIQSSTDLSSTNNWVTLTNLTLTSPVQVWVDTTVNASSPFVTKYFYQILPGQ